MLILNLDKKKKLKQKNKHDKKIAADKKPIILTEMFQRSRNWPPRKIIGRIDHRSRLLMLDPRNPKARLSLILWCRKTDSGDLRLS